MSTFRNITQSLLVVQGYLRGCGGTLGVGAQKYIEPNEEFTGSNYYKRFTYDGLISNGYSADLAAENAILELVTDDGTPFSDSAVNSPNNPRVYYETLSPGEELELDFETDLGGPAMFFQMDTSENIYVYLNNNADARLYVSSAATQIFNNGELLLSKVTLDYTEADSGDPDVVVQIVVANIV